MKKAVILSLLILALLSSLTVCAWADGGDAFEPVTVVDDDTVKIVVTELSNSPADGAASFTLEIENKTDMGLDFGLRNFSVNDMMCTPQWRDDYSLTSLTVPAGETVSASASWDADSLQRAGVNYAQSAEGIIHAEWNFDEYYTQYQTIDLPDDWNNNGGAAYNALQDQLESSKRDIPISLTFPPVDTDVPASGELTYYTDFEPVVIVDNEDITAVVHDFYRSGYREGALAVNVSVENHTAQSLRITGTSSADGTELPTFGVGPVSAGKTLVSQYYFSGAEVGVDLSAAETVSLTLTFYDEDNNVYLEASVDLDTASRSTSSDGTFGMAKSADSQSASQEDSGELYWVPDPKADAAAMTTLGDNGEYLLGMTYTDEVFSGYQALLLYFENNSSDSIDFYSYNVMLNGSPFPDNMPNVFASFSEELLVPPGGAINLVLMDDMAPFPTGGFSLDFDIDYLSADHYVIAKDSISATVSETGEATITSVN